MSEYKNPFEFDAATTLSLEEVLDFYIEDFNYTRLIQSKRNIFLGGERGSGKSMTLIYNSLPVQLLNSNKNRSEPDLDHVGIYIPCNTPLIHKKEYELIDNEFHASILSEHFLVLSIIFELASALKLIPNLGESLDEQGAREDLRYSTGIDIPEGKCFFDAIITFSSKELAIAQQAVNSMEFEFFYDRTLSFSSFVITVFKILKTAEKLQNSHFMLLFDDAHDLNRHQNAFLNSLIAYRDRSIFSIKVALADFDKHDFQTHSGATILEGHDFISIDMEKPYQRSTSPFGMFAKRIIEQRLEKIGVTTEVESFFPTSPDFVSDLEKTTNQAREEAIKLFGSKETKKISDHIYKNARVIYFRNRGKTANLPPYSGWETITHVSTGVVRNLLEPCYWMYDQVVSEKHFKQDEDPVVSAIPPDIQRQVILDRSQKLWEQVKDRLSRSVEECSTEQQTQIYNLFDNLAVLFRKRLLTHKSEPRAIVFSISSQTPELTEKLDNLIHILRRARLLYIRSGPAKDEGRRETYYVPNRMLWPIRGLDVVGQHARVSLKASDVWNAANGIPFPYTEEPTGGNPSQGALNV